MILLVFLACSSPDVPFEPLEAPDPTLSGPYATFEVPKAFADANSHWCWMAVDTHAVALGMPTGDVYESPEGFSLPTYDTSVWNEEAYSLGSTSKTIRKSALDGTPAGEFEVEPEESINRVLGVGVWQDLLAVPTRRTLRLFDYPEALEAGDAIEVPWDIRGAVSRVVIEGDRAYGYWHATDTIEVFAMPGGDALPPILLQDYDDWVYGLDVVGDRLFLLHNGNTSSVFMFDLDGNFLDFWRLGARAQYGIWCDGVE